MRQNSDGDLTMAAEYSKTEYELIKNTFVFRGCGDEVLRHALQSSGCLRLDHPKGTSVFSPERYMKALGVIVRGSVQVSKNTADGHRLAISRLNCGDVFGAAAIFNDMESFATTLTALQDCTVIYFPESLIRSMMTDDFTIAENYIRYQSGRIRFLSSKIDGLSAGSAENRLAKYLLENSGASGTVAASMTELAEMLNIGRASLYRAIDSLCQAGAVKKEGKKLTVTDPEKLRQL